MLRWEGLVTLFIEMLVMKAIVYGVGFANTLNTEAMRFKG